MRGQNLPLALEGALKLKEISYIHAEGCAAGEMKHGPIALIDETVPVIVLAPNDDLPVCDPFVAPLLHAIPTQLLAYHVTVLKGTDVDQPRNLAKSVTVE
jgi:glutamine---fructose-6-phosphate transaminase (isomerizing)